MKAYQRIVCGSLFSEAILLVVLSGCSSESQPASETTTAAEASVDSSAGRTLTGTDLAQPAATEEEHIHKPGSHGGIIIPIGSDSYHAEAVIQTTGEFRLLMLGKDESRIQEVEVQSVKAYVKVSGDPNATAVELIAVPQEGDSAMKTSQFVGQLPEALRGRPLDITIPNLQIAGERFRVGFTTAAETHADEMPVSVRAEEEKNLYLTAAGKYTEADIEANGSMTATQKFKGIKSSHDAKPKPGDRVCPISMTKANPQFTWIIDGKSYQFCCPPCVDEFVKMAKERPEELQDPDNYIKGESP